MTKTTLINPVDESAERLQCAKLTLDSLFIDRDANGKTAIIGRVKIINLGYHKTVFARITFDDWVTYRDYNASYLESIEKHEHVYDIFGFGFLRNDGSAKKAEFVLSCVQDGIQYWDNNNEQNYCFELDEELVATENSDLFATNWRATDNGELIVEESDYAHFQPHPLTPTKIRFYSIIRNAPEKEIIPTKAKDDKHLYAYKDIAFECMLDLYETQPEEEVVSVMKTSEESCQPPGEGEPDESGLVEVEQSFNPDSGESTNPIMIEEDLIQPEEVAKPEPVEEDIFDKLEKEANQINVEIDPGSETENAPYKVEESNVVKNNASTQSSDNVTAQQTEICPEKSCDESTAQQQAKSHQSNTPSTSSHPKNGEQTTKEAIENEESPRRKKKSLFSKLCCGQAEHD